MTLKVLLVDDHELVRTGFRRILETDENIEVVGESESGEEAVLAADLLTPDLILMDVSMPGIGGIEATRRIRRQNPHIQVIAVTVHANTPFPEQLHDAGALGYLSKGCPATEMLTAIKSVAAGQPYIDREISERLLITDLVGNTSGTPFSDLSQREMQVLMMILQGRTTQEISDSLCLSPKTISTYRHRLYDKLDISNDVELTRLALRQGIIEI